MILTEKGITVKSGAVFCAEKILPDKAKLYSMSFTLPLDRRFGVEGMVFFAVKGTIIVLPLKKEDIKRIKESLV